MKYFMIVLRVLRVCVCVLSSSSMSSVVWRSGRSLASSVLGLLIFNYFGSVEILLCATLNTQHSTAPQSQQRIN